MTAPGLAWRCPRCGGLRAQLYVGKRESELSPGQVAEVWVLGFHCPDCGLREEAEAVDE